ncbi:MAG TPA: C-GCAxxG-C-C family protein [Humidesulfovibrio sp.]|uniref:C-GCAxxG-C-C family protein n=1 Tax=Humidesulfovibrio sp. TaxID=2910988 RepID=UPI002C7CCD94|nr:C-GCAxxG-C-C family protein [Humidesulfovibrio sp.]HWR02952.1 C-GCAxxG-C-C family protein [Humidesulfovibrio sp.]
MNSQEVDKRAVELMEGGLHCAEAVLVAVLEGQGLPTDVAPRAASAFGAGVGRSKKGLCGALSGGLIALGLVQGRESAEEPWDDIAIRAEAVRSWFAEAFGCTRCEAVLEKLSPQRGNELCIGLTGRTAAKFHEVLNAPVAAKAAVCGCGCTAQATAQAQSSGCGCS